MKFAVLEEFEYLFAFVAHKCTGGGSSIGTARLTVAREELTESATQPLNVSNLTMTRAIFRSGARLASKVARPGRLQEGLDVSSLDTTKQQVQVTLASDRQQQLQTIGHWVAIFQFGDDDLCVC